MYQELDDIKLANLIVNQLGAKQDIHEVSELIYKVGEWVPTTILEIGSALGGTIPIWTSRGTDDATIISVDIANNPNKNSLWNSWTNGEQVVECICGDSITPKVYESVLTILDGRKLDVLFLDGDHHYDGVRLDYDIYHDLVRPGGRIILHDIAIRRNDMEVWKLWYELRGTYRNDYIVNPDSYCGIGILYVGD